MIEKDEIIQIKPQHKWGGCLAVVSQVKSFGCVAYVSIPSNDGTPPGQAFIRLEHDEYEWFGVKALYIPKGEE